MVGASGGFGLVKVVNGWPTSVCLVRSAMVLDR